MIKIDQTSTTRPKKTAKSKKARTLSDNGFSELMNGLAQHSATTGSPGNISPNTALCATAPTNELLALQEVSHEEMERKGQLKQAHKTLDILEKLRERLLIGSVPSYMLRTLEEHMVALKQREPNPEIKEVIEEIELRAAVELAKLRMSK